MKIRSRLAVGLLLVCSASARAARIRTNEVLMPDAPSWLTVHQVNQVVDRIQDKLEWDIRRIQVFWYTDEAAFERMHHLGPLVLAFTRKPDNTVYLGPRVTASSFAPVFGHELVHVIIYQKYKNAIPGWLEEGLANHLAGQGKVDYAWLNRYGFQGDVHELVHPFQGYVMGPSSLAADEQVRYHYMASQALAEMIAARCGGLEDLLQLSVGKRLETYLSTTCGIKDLNAEFRRWLKAHPR